MKCRLAVRFGLLLPLAVAAQGQDRYADSGYVEPAENVTFAYADVLRVDPIYETFVTREPSERCYEQSTGYRERSGGGGTVLGAIIGGVLGNTVGKGDGRRAATVAGAVVGGVVGHDIEKNNGSAGGRDYRGTRQHCESVEIEREDQRIAGYDVQYRFRGEVFMSRLNYDPGQRLRVRVAVTPAE
ncbi:MAG: hypothetical protein COS34_09880 [Lysobacterales bacterium CG02_land_8_20_14_3_00_62_12]|nr:MAG: hypothetical protein COS34_09880 [Xanthomonadales bacterium CG02_land_8_20_14_3_00_62_12]